MLKPTGEDRADGSMCDVLERLASRPADAAALLAPGRPAATYDDLLDRIATAGDALRRFGVERGQRVVVSLPDTADTAALFLALVDVGVCCPMNPLLTEPEMADYLGAVRPVAVVVQRGLSAGVRRVAGELGAGVIDMVPRPAEAAGTFTLELAAPPAVVPAPSSDGDEVLILPTSGTTAGAKLVPLTLPTMLAGARASVRAYRLGPDDRRLNVMPLFHVQGLVGSVLTSLVAGSSVLCCPAFDPGLVLRWVEEYEVTWLSGSPTMHRAVLDVAAASARRAAGTVRFVRGGSAPFPPALLDEIEHFWGVPVVESYGMTEAHQIASSPLPPAPRKRGTVGVPTGSEVVITDDAGRPLPTGETGEILVRGPNVVTRYLASDEVNAASFVDGWLRTGDIGRLDGDGFLTITDRVKEVIIRGGEKVSPREVDAALEAHPAVARAAAFGYPHPTTTQEVGAAVVVVPGMSVTEDELTRFASGRLARFKVPKRIVVVDDLPTGSTGKVQRNRLAEQCAPPPDAITDVVDLAAPADERVPQGPIEAALVGIWAHALACEKVGVDDDFFELGGESMSGTVLLGMVREVLGADINAVMLYEEANTVARMAAVIERLRDATLSDRA